MLSLKFNWNDFEMSYLDILMSVLTSAKRNVRTWMRLNSMLLYWIEEWAKKVVLLSSFQKNTRLENPNLNNNSVWITIRSCNLSSVY